MVTVLTSLPCTVIHTRGRMVMRTTNEVLEIALIKVRGRVSILTKGTRADNACVCIDVKNMRRIRKIGEILDLL